MKNTVSTPSILPIASVISMSILSVVFVLPATGMVSGALPGLLTFVAATWVGVLSTRLMAQSTLIPAKSTLRS